MLVQDGLTGYLHEVPDTQLYGYDEVYDHLGNPVGMFPALAALASKVLPSVASAVMPAASNLIRRVLPAVAGAAGGPAAGIMSALPAMAGALARPGIPAPGMPGFPGIPGFPGMPSPFPAPMAAPPIPGGWMRPPAPYMGMRPRRVYLRCGMWPGEPGLVPLFAANTPGAPVLPGTVVPPAVAVATAAPAARRIVRRRRW
jgi:hypothetical protein